MGITISAEILGEDIIERNLAISEDGGFDALYNLTDSVAATIQDIMSQEPPETAANQPGPRGGMPSHIRTHTAATNWQRDTYEASFGVESRVFNPVPYAPWLYHPRYRKDWAIRYGWPALDEVAYQVIRNMDKPLDQIADELKEAIETGEFNEEEIAILDTLVASMGSTGPNAPTA